MKENLPIKNGLTRNLRIQISAEEYERLHLSFSMTTKRFFSDYLRALLLNQPVVAYTRNRSMDEMMAELISLRNSLYEIEEEFHKVLSTLQAMGPSTQVLPYLPHLTQQHDELLKTMETITHQIAQISDLWLQ